MSVQFLKFYFFILISCLFAGMSAAQSLNTEDYVVTQFGLDEGLPQSSVNDIIQTKDGYIWLATYGGLVRFDGLKFTTFNRSNTPGMVEERLLSIYEDPEGGIWLFPESTQNKILRYSDGEVKSFTLDKRNESVFRMRNSKDGGLWVTSVRKILKFDGLEFQEVAITKSETNGSAKDFNDGTLVNINKKIIFLKGDKAIEIADFTEEVKENFEDSREYPAGSGELILSTRSEGLYKYADGEISRLKFQDSISGMIFNNFGVNNNDKRNLFVEYLGHIGVWDGAKVMLFNPIDYNTPLNFKSILEDSEGNIWFGTDANGLFKVRASGIKMIDRGQGLLNERMLSLNILKDGSGLFSTNCGGVFEWRDGKAYPSKIQEFFLSGCNWSVFQDSKDRIWIGGGGVYVTNSLNEEGTYFGEEEGFTNAGVVAMIEDSRQNIWVASVVGLFVYDGEKFSKKFTEADGLYYIDVRSMLEDRQGKIWIGSAGGLNTIQGDIVNKVPLNSEPESSSQSDQPYVRAIYQDAENYMWIGTYGEGLYRIGGDKIQQLTVSDGLFDNVISHIVEDEEGYFWMGSNRGIVRVKRKDLSDYLDGKIESFTIDTFGTNEGMNSAETNGGFQPNAVKDTTGKIYFPTIEGVAVVDPSKVSNNSIPPPVYIERLRSEEREFSPYQSIQLSHNTAFLEINYTGISFTDPEKIQFRYKMNGLDDIWIDVGNQRSAIYSKIPPGDYTFQVIAANSDGVWNNVGASLNIIVTPPFWQRAWFIGILTALFIGCGYTFYLVRTNLLREENERQKRFTEQLMESQENERRRIASELHDGLGQQILVIKNRVELAKQHINDSPGISEQLDEIQYSATRSIEDVRNISHALRPVLLEKFGLTDALNEMCEEIQKSTSIEWSFHIDEINEVIPKEKHINFYRVIQESINNILKHSKADEASVMIRHINNEVNVVIFDNGIGFNSVSAETKKGLGFLGMKERVENLGGTILVNSVPGEETVVKINVPAINKS